MRSGPDRKLDRPRSQLPGLTARRLLHRTIHIV